MHQGTLCLCGLQPETCIRRSSAYAFTSENVGRGLRRKRCCNPRRAPADPLPLLSLEDRQRSLAQKMLQPKTCTIRPSAYAFISESIGRGFWRKTCCNPIRPPGDPLAMLSSSESVGRGARREICCNSIRSPGDPLPMLSLAEA